MIAESLLAASLLVGANYADMHTTQRALALCPNCVEANPFIGPHAERLVPLKIAATALQTAVFVSIRKRHKKTAWGFVAVVVGGNLAIARHNSRQGRR